jgi:hypothetical protein
MCFKKKALNRKIAKAQKLIEEAAEQIKSLKTSEEEEKDVSYGESDESQRTPCSARG